MISTHDFAEEFRERCRATRDILLRQERVELELTMRMRGAGYADERTATFYPFATRPLSASFINFSRRISCGAQVDFERQL